MRQILVSGSRGFIGSHLVTRLAQEGHGLSLADRVPPQNGRAYGRHFSIGDIGPDTDWRAALDGCDCVVHLAGQTSGVGDDAGVCDRVNAQGTRRLIQQASEAGVSMFVFLSSVMALVDNRATGIVRDDTASTATSAYGRSKLAAEGHVVAFAQDGRVGISLRPPLVYGPGAKGKWRQLHQLARSGVPLPFGAVGNRRSLISVGNLVDAIATTVARGREGLSGAYLVSDAAEAVSLADIVQLLREGARASPRLVPVPPWVLRATLRLAGRRPMADSLLGDLVVDSEPFRQAFSWSPVETAEAALRRAGGEASTFSGTIQIAGSRKPSRPA